MTFRPPPKHCTPFGAIAPLALKGTARECRKQHFTSSGKQESVVNLAFLLKGTARECRKLSIFPSRGQQGKRPTNKNGPTLSR